MVHLARPVLFGLTGYHERLNGSCKATKRALLFTCICEVSNETASELGYFTPVVTRFFEEILRLNWFTPARIITKASRNLTPPGHLHQRHPKRKKLNFFSQLRLKQEQTDSTISHFLCNYYNPKRKNDKIQNDAFHVYCCFTVDHDVGNCQRPAFGGISIDCTCFSSIFHESNCKT